MKILAASPEGQEFGGDATSGESVFESTCPKSRISDCDGGYFQPMPTFHSGFQEAIEIRKTVNGLSI